MSRLLCFLLALALCGPAGAADYLPASTVQRQTQQLQSDVATLRSLLATSGADQRAILTALAPRLQDRVHAARLSAATFDQQTQAAQIVAEFKRQAAEVKEHIQNLEALIQLIPVQTQALSEAQRKLEAVAQKIEVLMPKLLALVASDPGAPRACTLPHARMAGAMQTLMWPTAARRLQES